PLRHPAPCAWRRRVVSFSAGPPGRWPAEIPHWFRRRTDISFRYFCLDRNNRLVRRSRASLEPCRIVRMPAVNPPPLPKHLLAPDAGYGWRAVIRNLGGFGALLALTPALAGHWAWAPAFLMPAIGLMTYRMTIVMHDCAHETLFPSRRLNRVVGTLLG